MRDLSDLKRSVQEYLMMKMPGMLSFLNTLCVMNHGLDCVTLLLTSPSKLYVTLLNHYRGDMLSADYAFTLVFINPIISHLKKPELTQSLLELVKTSRDAEFLELITRS